MDKDKAAITCSHCGYRFVVDIANFIAENLEDFGPNPSYMGTSCPKCHLSTTVNIVSPLSSQWPTLRRVR